MAASNFGKPQDALHRAKIAEAQRARRAALAEVTEALPSPLLPRLARPVRAREEARLQTATAAASDVQRPPLVAATRMSKADVNLYKADLHEYRELRRSLEGWSGDFQALHGRRPDRNDVQATGVLWLIQTHASYARLKTKLLKETVHGGVRASLAREARLSM